VLGAADGEDDPDEVEAGVHGVDADESAHAAIHEELAEKVDEIDVMLLEGLNVVPLSSWPGLAVPSDIARLEERAVQRRAAAVETAASDLELGLEYDKATWIAGAEWCHASAAASGIDVEAMEAAGAAVLASLAALVRDAKFDSLALRADTTYERTGPMALVKEVGGGYPRLWSRQPRLLALAAMPDVRARWGAIFSADTFDELYGALPWSAVLDAPPDAAAPGDDDNDAPLGAPATPTVLPAAPAQDPPSAAPPPPRRPRRRINGVYAHAVHGKLRAFRAAAADAARRASVERDEKKKKKYERHAVSALDPRAMGERDLERAPRKRHGSPFVVPAPAHPL